MKFSCYEQLAGIVAIDFFLLEETSNWPVHLSDRSSTQVVFNPSIHAVDATVEDNSLVNSSKWKGDVFEVDLSYTILTRSEALEQLLDQYAAYPGVAVVEFQNGFTKIFGTDQEPLYMNYQNIDGSSIDSKAGIEITITGIQRNRPVFLTK